MGSLLPGRTPPVVRVLAFAFALCSRLLAQVEEPTERVALPPLASTPIDPGLPATENPPAGSFLLVHHLKLASVSWLGKLPAGTDPWWGELEYSPRLSWEPHVSWALKADFLLRFARAKRSRSLRGEWDGGWVEYEHGEVHSQRDRQYFAPRELFVAYRGSLDLAIGWQIVSWARSDGIRPMDLFQRQDASDRLRTETLGVPSVTAAYGQDDWAFDAVWVPSSAVDRIAVDARNPWALLPRASLPALFVENAPKPRLENGEAGLRFSYTGQAWDGALLAAYTRDRSPSYLVLTPNVSSGRLEVRPEYLAQWVFGASFALPLGSYLIRTEALYARYLRPREPIARHGARGVAGVERRGEITSGMRYATIVQYALDTTSPGRMRASGSVVSSPSRFYRHALTLFGSLVFQERFELEARLLAELKYGSGLASILARYRPMDGVALWVGGDGLRGPDESWLGRAGGKGRLLLGVDFQTQ